MYLEGYLDNWKTFLIILSFLMVSMMGGVITLNWILPKNFQKIYNT